MTTADPARTSPAPDLLSALDPVRRALHDAARLDGERAMADATTAAHAARTAAAAEAEGIRAQARASGAADAAAFLAAERSRAVREARAAVLRADREAFDDLRTAARTAVVALRDDPDHPRLRRQLVGVVRAVLGPDAAVLDSDDGGVVGTAPGRRVDLSLAVLAERAVTAVVGATERSGPP